MFTSNSLKRSLPNQYYSHSKTEALVATDLRDTASSAAILAYDVYEGFHRKEESAVEAPDLEDAYNRVDFKALVHQLRDMHLDVWIVRWIASMLLSRNRSITVWSVDIRTQTDCIRTSTGTIEYVAMNFLKLHVLTSRSKGYKALGTSAYPLKGHCLSNNT
jgi:hypothetical protein